MKHTTCIELLRLLLVAAVQLISHGTAVTTLGSIAPGHHGAITKDGSKGV